MLFLTAALGLALAAGLFFSVRLIMLRVWSTATVPNVVGLEIKDAEELLTREGLKFEEMFFSNENVKANVVFMQAPDEHEIKQKGDTVISTKIIAKQEI